MDLDQIKNQLQDIPQTNAGRAMEAIEIAGIMNPTLKSKIKKLIYYTFDDTFYRLKEFNYGREQR